MRWILFLIAATTMLGMSQTVLYVWQTPPNHTFPFIHNFIEDYYQYLDIMRQGWDGWWVATSRLTPEVYPSVVVNVFLLFLGHAARVLNISLPLTYTGARLLGGVVLMVLVYQLIRRTFPQSMFKRIVAICFVLFGTYFWGWGAGGPTVAPLTRGWTELDPIFRWSFVPHHLWSKAGMVAVFLLLLKTRVTLRTILLLAFVTLAAGMTNPVVYTTMVPTVGLWFLLELVRGEPPRKHIRFYAPWIVVIVISGAVALYHRTLQTQVFPWTSYAAWEATLSYRVHPFDYARSLGPAALLFVFAIPVLFRLGRVGRLFLAWAASSWIMLYMAAPFVPITPERFLGGYQFIPLGIGAAAWIFSLKGVTFFRLGVVVVLFVYFAIGLGASFKQHAGYVAANRTNPQVYIPLELMAAFTYLSEHSKPEDVVMAPYEISTMIPGLIGRRVMAGHAQFTKDVMEKKTLIDAFFSTRDPETAQRILTSYNVRWILADAAWLPQPGSRGVVRYGNQRYALYFWQ